MSYYTIETLYLHAIRSGVIRNHPDCPSPVIAAYDGVIQPLAAQYITACDAVTTHKQLAVNAKKAMDEVLAHINQPFNVARAAVKLHTGATVEVPPALSEPTTETAVKLAIQKVVELVEPHRGQPWADAILGGPFPTLAPDAMAKIDAYVSASRDHAHAVTARGQAYDALYEPFLAFKDVVRQACGKSSPDYRSIHLRAHPESAATTPDATTTDPKPVAPAPTVTAPAVSAAPVAAPTPTNGGAGPSTPTTS